MARFLPWQSSKCKNRITTAKSNSGMFQKAQRHDDGGIEDGITYIINNAHCSYNFGRQSASGYISFVPAPTQLTIEPN